MCAGFLFGGFLKNNRVLSRLFLSLSSAPSKWCKLWFENKGNLRANCRVSTSSYKIVAMHQAKVAARLSCGKLFRRMALQESLILGNNAVLSATYSLCNNLTVFSLSLSWAQQSRQCYVIALTRWH